MKKFVLSIIIAAGGLITQNAAAQVGVNVGLRIGPLVINVHKPIAPAVVYDDFYYLPEVDAYYSVPERCYYYMDGGGSWVNAAYLPGRYHDYDWRTAHRYEVRAQRPYANHEYYRNKYNGNRGGNWANDQYAYRGPQGRDDRGNYGRFPSSPYDSNNAGGRGGYNQPNRNNGGYRNDDNRGNWNGQGRDNNDRGNNRNGWNQPGRIQGDNNQGSNSQGGRDGNTNWQPSRGGNQNGYGQPSNPNNQPSNQNAGRDGNTNWQPNRGGNNQPASQNGDRGGNRGNDNRSNMPDRMHFSRNMVESNGRMQVARN
jgi:hypothetical protein